MLKEDLRTHCGGARLAFPAAIIAIVAFGVYCNTLFNAFVYDDADQVLKNPWIRDARYLPEMFTKSVWSFRSESVVSNYYRPLMHLFYFLNYQFFGLKPWGFHLVNVLMHAGVSILVFSLASRLLGESSSDSLQPTRMREVFLFPPFIAAILFATHPVHTEAVAWIAGLPELLFTFFSLLSFYFYLRAGAGFGRNYWFSVALFFVATLCKETALALPALLLAYDCAFERQPSSFSFAVKRYAPHGLVAAAYLLLRHHALGGFAPEQRHVYLTTYQYAINAFPLFAQYLEKLILPVHLNAFYVFHPIFSILQWKGLLSLVVTGGFVLLAALSWKRNKLLFLSTIIIGIPLLPVLYIPALGENSFADRYLYLPSMGFTVLVSLGAGTVITAWKRPVIVTAMLLAVTGLYAAGTIQRNVVWKDDESLYGDTLRKSPDAVLMQYNFGSILMDKGQFDAAIERFRAAISLNPGFVRARSNLGVLFMKKGWLDQGVEQLETAVRIDPYSADAHRNLGTAYGQVRALEKATEQFRMVAQLEPDSAKAQSDLGMALSNLGLVDTAIEQYQTAIRLDPNYAEAHYNLGLAYERKGLRAQAITEYQKALTIDPEMVDAHYSLGSALVTSEGSDAAVEHFGALVQLRPQNAYYRNLLGIEFGKKGMLDEAIEQLEAAVRLDPEEPAYRRNLERAKALRGSAGG